MNSSTNDARTCGSTTIESAAPALRKLAMKRDIFRIIASLSVRPQEYYRTLDLAQETHGLRFVAIFSRPREVGLVSICVLILLVMSTKVL